MIVKVQQALASSNGQRPILIYDKRRHFTQEIHDPVEAEKVAALLGDRAKGYFFAEMGAQGKIKLGAQATDQSW